jgi:hypothetical protein
MEHILTVIDYKINIISLTPLTTLVILESTSTYSIGITKEDFIHNFKKLYNRSAQEYVLFQLTYNDIYWEIYITYTMIANIIDDLQPLPVED